MKEKSTLKQNSNIDSKTDILRDKIKFEHNIASLSITPETIDRFIAYNNAHTKQNIEVNQKVEGSILMINKKNQDLLYNIKHKKLILSLKSKFEDLKNAIEQKSSTECSDEEINNYKSQLQNIKNCIEDLTSSAINDS